MSRPLSFPFWLAAYAILINHARLSYSQICTQSYARLKNEATMCGNELLGRGTRCFPSYGCDNCAYHYCIYYDHDYNAHIQTKVQWNWKQNMTNKSPDPRSGYATETLQQTMKPNGPWNLSSRHHCPKFCIYPNIICVSCLKKKKKRGNLTLYPSHDPDMLWDSPWAGGNTSVWASRLRILPPINTKSV